MKTNNAAITLLLRQAELPEALLGQPMEAADFNIGFAAKNVPYSDVIMSQLLKEYFGQMLTYIPTEGQWYVWNGRIHEPIDKLGNKDTFSLSLATDVAHALRDALEFVEQQCIEKLPTMQGAGTNVVTAQQQYANTFKKQRKFRDSLFMTKGLNSLTKQLELVFSAPEDTFTNDQRWLVVRNGVFDLYEIEKKIKALKPGEPFPRPTLHKHDPDRAVARNIEADWKPGASRKAWTKFLAESIPDEETREYLKVLTGAAFAGWEKPKTIPNLQGPKDSGKTVFVKTLVRLGGGGMGYAREVSPTVLMENQRSEYERAALRGLRFVGMSEPSNSDKLDAAFVKQLTGGDMVTTRGIREAPIIWQPQCVVFVASNDPVRFQSRDTALLDRVKLLNFPHRHWSLEENPDATHVHDPHLEKNLAEEGSGILAWILLGMMEFFRKERTVVTPAAAELNRESLRVAGSSVQRWLSDMVELGMLIKVPEAQRADRSRSEYVNRSEAWDCYKSWSDASEERPLSKHKFLEELYTEFPQKPTGGFVCLYGLLATDQWRRSEMASNGWGAARY